MAIFSLMRRPRRRRAARRVSRRRHNPKFGLHRPVLRYGRGGWHRSRRARLLRRSVRLINAGPSLPTVSNPLYGYHRPSLHYTSRGWKRGRHSRLLRRHARINPRRRWYRRNPKIPFGMDKMAIAGAKVAGGIVVGMLGMPVAVRLATMLPGNLYQYRRFFGLFHVVVGSVLSTTMKNKHIREMALVVAGVGVYDLIASNIAFLGLTPIPDVSKLIPMTAAAAPAAGDEPGVIGMGASYQQVGADYAPALGASYEGDDISYGDDAIDIG